MEPLRIVRPEPVAPLSFASQIPLGRLVELSGQALGPSARTTTAVSIVRAMQLAGDTTAWIQPHEGTLFPADLHEAGVDLDALVIVHIPAVAGAIGAIAAAELLLRSGAFGLVVVDLVEGTPPGTAEPWLGRLSGLARQHESCVVLLTESPRTHGSLGTMVSVRAEPRRTRLPGGGFEVHTEVIKDKTGRLDGTYVQAHRGPWGLP